MANKRSREVANCGPETSQNSTMVTDLSPCDTIPESVPGAETLDLPKPDTPSGYEQFREQRIKENLARMQKLGIVDLSLKLKTTVAAKRATRNYSSERQTPIRVLATEPRRRSSRLQNVTPVSYMENEKLPKEEGKGRKIYMEEGSKPEIYTEEHEKLLGSTELPWTLFVDGYGTDGKRIYDPVKGKTCHQCRQKTLGHRTHCCKCQLVQGQFCGDCLYMRYGEHVLEANKNPDWTCPACRGICNCSLCRQAKGWAPTGTMYKRISSLGYKSVAHYLIQTKRAPPTTEKESEENVNNTPHSAKRSLAFTDMEVSADDKELHNKIIGWQKLDYAEKENGESEDISVLHVGDMNSGESKNEYEKSEVSMHSAEKENGESNVTSVEKENGKSKDECEKSDVPMLHVEKENGESYDSSVLNVGDMKTVESKDEYKKSDVSMLNVENDDPNHATKSVSSCEPKTAASEATVKIDQAGENEVIAGNTPTATKTCRAKRVSAPLANQDSIARRLRSRVKLA